MSICVISKDHRYVACPTVSSVWSTGTVHVSPARITGTLHVYLCHRWGLQVRCMLSCVTSQDNRWHFASTFVTDEKNYRYSGRPSLLSRGTTGDTSCPPSLPVPYREEELRVHASVLHQWPRCRQDREEGVGERRGVGILQILVTIDLLPYSFVYAKRWRGWWTVDWCWWWWQSVKRGYVPAATACKWRSPPPPKKKKKRKVTEKKKYLVHISNKSNSLRTGRFSGFS